MTNDMDILIIGGGLAGLTAGIHLARHRLRVLLIEKQAYPHHKVCGEYVSNEVLPYLEQLEIQLEDLQPSHLQRFLLSTVDGKTIGCDLPLGGFGVSRYALDHHLYQKALAAGVNIVQAQVTEVHFENDAFTVVTSEEKRYTAQIIIGAYGKRSNIDKQLQREFIKKKSPWLGIKAHYQAEFPADLVALHNFRGGYCGLSQVEGGVVNACYLAHYESFKQYKNTDDFQERILCQNPFLKDFFSRAVPLFDKPLAISQVAFSQKKSVENHILMCGDTAGLIHPLCGNGMAMAIHSAKIASELIIKYFQRKIENREELETQYATSWDRAFKKRLFTGRLVQSVLQSASITSVLLKGLQLYPSLLPLIVKQTHGEVLEVEG
jgi:menaquinone-9 beta-reductase